MGRATDVTLVLEYDIVESGGHADLLDYLSHLDEDIVGSQEFHLVAGEEVSEHLPGSGQAGTNRIYTARFRKINPTMLLEHLREAPWNGLEAVVVVADDYESGMTMEKLGGNGNG